MSANSGGPIDGARSVETAFALRTLPLAQRQVFETLVRDGPQTRESLATPRMTPLQRLYGVTEFSVSRVNHGNERRATFGAGGAKSVYYLYFDHEPRDVLRAFFDANPRFIETATVRGASNLIGDHGEQWSVAFTDLIDEYGFATQYRTAEDGDDA